MIENVLIVGNLTSLLFSLIAISLGIYSAVKTVAMEKSTHNVEYVPIDPKFASSEKEIEEYNKKAIADFPETDDDEITDPQDLKIRDLI